jgi:uncharacterized protein (DUF934 family)
MHNSIKLIAIDADATWPTAQNDLKGVVTLAADADPQDLSLNGVERIDLHFAKFTDGRAYSQAYLLRRRMGFAGDIRATGDVLVDQVAQLQRSGFSSAVLRADQNLSHATRQFSHFEDFYQGDAAQPAAHFGSPGVVA